MIALIHLIHGKKHVEEKLGWVADFCPICHEVRCFDFKRISLVKHFYFMAYGKRKFVQDRIECTACGLWLRGHEERYARMENSHVFRNDVDALAQSTFPGLHQFYAERLALEQKIKKNPDELQPETRAQYMFEIFRLMDPQMESYFKGKGVTRFDRKSVTGGLGLLVLFGVLLAIGLSLPENTLPQDVFVALALLTLLFAAIFGLTQFALVPRRMMRNQLMPRLARGLRPFNPMEAELAALLAKCNKLKMFIGRKTNPVHIMSALKATPKERIQ